jgi:hypothetical protein
VNHFHLQPTFSFHLPLQRSLCILLPKLPPEVPPVAKPKAIKVRIKKVAPATKSKKETEATVLAKGIITEEIKSNECEYSITTTIHEYGRMLIKSPYSCP